MSYRLRISMQALRFYSLYSLYWNVCARSTIPNALLTSSAQQRQHRT